MEIENHKEEVPFAYYEGLFRNIDPVEVSARTGVKWDGKEFYVNLLGREYAIAWPEYGIKADGACRPLQTQEKADVTIPGWVETKKETSPASLPAGACLPLQMQEKADVTIPGWVETKKETSPASLPAGACLPLQMQEKADVTIPGWVETKKETSPASLPAGACPPLQMQTFLLRYLLEGKQVAWGGQWKTFREMPWGEMYIKPYTGRVLTRAAFTFGTRIEKFRDACEKMGATPLKHGDAGYQFDFLGGYRVQIMVWEGDEEFPPNAQVIYSDNFEGGFAAEDRVVAGDILISAIKGNM